MKRFLIVLCIVAVLLPVAACGKGDTGAKGDAAAIEDTLKGYVTTYNAGNFAKCLTYFTDYGDEDDALALLSFLRSMSGKLVLKEVRHISISDQTATATVVFTIGGEEGTDQMQLRKVQGKWKIVWEQEALTGDSAAIRDTIVGYLAAYNAGDFVGCLTYLTGFGDEQEARGSLSLIKEHIGTITFIEIGSIYIVGERATAQVDYVFWWKTFSREIEFRKEADVWKIVCGRPWEIGTQLPMPSLTVQRLIPGSVEIAADLSGVVEAKLCVLEGDDGTQAWLWEAWRVRNAGSQTLHLNIVLESYGEDGSRWGGGSLSADLGPGEVEGPNYTQCTLYDLGYGPSHYKLIIESTS